MAGEFALHASIVHLAGVVADHEELESSRRPAALPFNPHALTATRFVPANLPALLADARAQLHDTSGADPAPRHGCLAVQHLRGGQKQSSARLLFGLHRR